MEFRFSPYVAEELRLLAAFISDLASLRESQESELTPQNTLNSAMSGGMNLAGPAAETAGPAAEPSGGASAQAVPELTQIEARGILATLIGDDDAKRVKLVGLLEKNYQVNSINLLTPESRAAFVALAKKEIT